MAKLPPTFEGLFDLADAKLKSKFPEGGRAKRVFMSSGDEISAEEFDCIEHDDVLYFSQGEDWLKPPATTDDPSTTNPNEDKPSAPTEEKPTAVSEEAAPAEKAPSKPPPKPAAKLPSRAANLPEGWSRVECTSSGGKQYRRFVGPKGKKAQSAAEAWRIHNNGKQPSEPTVKAKKNEPTKTATIAAIMTGAMQKNTATSPQVEVTRASAEDPCTGVPVGGKEGSNAPEEAADEEAEELFEVEAIIDKRIVTSPLETAMNKMASDQMAPDQTTSGAPTSAAAPQSWMDDVLGSQKCEDAQPQGEDTQPQVTVQYLVIWRGYGREENTWVASSDILDPDLIADYEQRCAELADMLPEVHL